MSGLLLDTNAAIWFMARDKMAPAALEAIAEAQSAGAIFVSPISAWEAALALRKTHGKPNLGGREAAQWFRELLKVPGLKMANLTRRVALEAAHVPILFGSGRSWRLLPDCDRAHQRRPHCHARPSDTPVRPRQAGLLARGSMLNSRACITPVAAPGRRSLPP
jgi:PIN domain nuclease of toxin-antitoxin system